MDVMAIDITSQTWLSEFAKWIARYVLDIIR